MVAVGLEECDDVVIRRLCTRLDFMTDFGGRSLREYRYYDYYEELLLKLVRIFFETQSVSHRGVVYSSLGGRCSDLDT
jgi:hypothetical protein